jgi:hypothetical protein
MFTAVKQQQVTVAASSQQQADQIIAGSWKQSQRTYGFLPKDVRWVCQQRREIDHNTISFIHWFGRTIFSFAYKWAY